MFAEHGFDGAKTQQIAAAANVSEALVYRHFPSKVALYRAVLRNLISTQNATFASFGSVEASSAGLVSMMYRVFRIALLGPAAPNAVGMRIILASLAGDGDYARLVYRRAHRLVIRDLEAALKEARRTGELTGPPISPSNVCAFMEHMMSMMLGSRLSGRPATIYAGDDERLLKEAVLFCGRGIGLSSEFIEAQFQNDCLTAS